MTMTRHLCLNLFQKVSFKLSLRRQQARAALNDDFRAEAVFGLEF